MASEVLNYLPGDPRHGLDEEGLRDYYRRKQAQWVIFCWDGPGAAAARAAAGEAQKAYARDLGEALIGFGHIVEDDDPSAILGTTWFVALDDRDAAEAFAAADPVAKAGGYARIDIRRWSNSFVKKASDYARKGEQYWFYTGSKLPDAKEFYAGHLKAHEEYFRAHGDRFVFRGPLRSPDGLDNVGTALLIELPDRAAAKAFWDNEPFAANGGYQDDSRMYRWVFGDEG